VGTSSAVVITRDEAIDFLTEASSSSRHHDLGPRAARRHQRDQQQHGAGSDEGHPTPDRSSTCFMAQLSGSGENLEVGGQMKRRPRRPKTCP
jgi:hypothetical protein